MTDLIVSESQIVERVLAMELVRVTERAAVSCARLRGRAMKRPQTRLRSMRCGASSTACRSTAPW